MSASAERIIKNVKFSYDVADNQENLFTPSHTRYKCRIVYCGRQYTFDYQCNPSYFTPEKKDCIYSIFSDANSYLSTYGLDDFLREFGYDDSLKNVRKGKKAYKACKKENAAIDRLFTYEERETLEEYFRNY